MTKWIDMGPIDRFPAGQRVCLRVQDQPLVVFNVDGRLLAIADVCPHAGRPLGEGELHGLVLTCPYHGYAYNIRSGRNAAFPHEELPVRTYPIRYREGRVQVRIDPR